MPLKWNVSWWRTIFVERLCPLQPAPWGRSWHLLLLLILGYCCLPPLYPKWALPWQMRRVAAGCRLTPPPQTGPATGGWPTQFAEKKQLHRTTSFAPAASDPAPSVPIRTLDTVCLIGQWCRRKAVLDVPLHLPPNLAWQHLTHFCDGSHRVIWMGRTLGRSEEPLAW